MKKILVILFVFAVLTGQNPCVQAQNVTLYGGVTQNVPKTANEVTAYLVKMKAIMKEYEVLSNQLVMVIMSRNITSDSANGARSEWIRLANKIDALVPPSELTSSHKKLAASLRNTSQFLVSINGSQSQQQALTSMMPVVSDLSSSAVAYQQGVSNVINRMGLDPSLNPLGTSSNMGLNANSLDFSGLGF